MISGVELVSYPRLQPLERRGGGYGDGKACGLARLGCLGLQEGQEATQVRQARGVGGGACPAAVSNAKSINFSLLNRCKS